MFRLINRLVAWFFGEREHQTRNFVKEVEMRRVRREIELADHQETERRKVDEMWIKFAHGRAHGRTHGRTRTGPGSGQVGAEGGPRG